MKKEKLYLVLTMSVMILLLVQSIKYNYLSYNKNLKEEVPVISIKNNNKPYKIEDFLTLIENQYVNINTLINEKNKFKAILNFNGNFDELIKYVKYLEEKNIIIKSYEIKMNEFLQCIMEVNT